MKTEKGRNFDCAFLAKGLASRVPWLSDSLQDNESKAVLNDRPVKEFAGFSYLFVSRPGMARHRRLRRSLLLTGRY